MLSLLTIAAIACTIIALASLCFERQGITDMDAYAHRSTVGIEGTIAITAGVCFVALLASVGAFTLFAAFRFFFA